MNPADAQSSLRHDLSEEERSICHTQEMPAYSGPRRIPYLAVTATKILARAVGPKTGG